MSPVIKNVVRTAVPAVVGAFVTFVTKQAAHISPSVQVIVFPIATTSYYSLVRLLEEKYPKLGWLLGALPQKPVAPSK